MPFILTATLWKVLLILAWTLLSGRPALAVEAVPDPDALTMLARAGAPRLALHKLEAWQPAHAEDPVTWMRLERQRVYLLRVLGDREAIIERLAALPATISTDFGQWAHTERATALLEVRRPGEALSVLRGLLWSGADADTEALMHWRRLVIQAYLQEGSIEDARGALVRYQQDFNANDREWNQLRAHVLLEAGRYRELSGLAIDGGESGAVLALAARLRGGVVEREEVHRAARELALAGETAPVARVLAWQLAVEAGRGLPLPEYIDTLEQALSQPRDVQVGRDLFPVTGEQLWQAWLDHGRRLGNQERLLLGADDDWYFLATGAMEQDALKARALFAVLSVHGSAPERRELAHEYLVSLLLELSGGEALVRRLYLEPRRLAGDGPLPGGIRFRLIDQALEDGDLPLAARLLRGMDPPGAGTDAAEWELRRARLAIHTGLAVEGASLLAGLLEREPPLSEAQLDRWVQGVFDLQTVAAHQEATGLLDDLLARELPPQRRRELLYWQADSWLALGKPARAAYLYLQSANLPDSIATDAWARAARYHAARSLAQAGLLEDARRVFQGLLEECQESGRRAMLRNEIQRLRLRAAVREMNP